MAKLTELKAGDNAPKFTLPGVPDAKYRLSEALQKGPVVVYFYPRDDTPGCTTEACGFRDNLKQLNKLNVTVFGISTDGPASHEKFREKYDLTFPLLSDEDHKVAEKYGVWVEKNMYGKKLMGIQRATFLVGKNGKLAEVWPKVKVDGHVDAVCAAIESL